MGGKHFDYWYGVVLAAILIFVIGQRVWRLAQTGAWRYEPVRFYAVVLAYLAVIAGLLWAGAYFAILAQR